MQTRFNFGKNWKSFNEKSDISAVEFSKSNLVDLLGEGEIVKKSVLDIGSGSGIHALSFLLLGAQKIKCIDLDENSVQATRDRLLESGLNRDNWSVELGDILEMTSNENEYFDVVYSWGVLHHTGDMKAAIINSANFCKSEGLLVLGIYRKTKLCGFWKIEKFLYNTLPSVLQKVIDFFFGFTFLLAQWIKKNSPRDYIENYRRTRGMDFMTDIRDWLGGYPYESASAREINNLLTGLGFNLVKSNTRESQFGLLGSGCNEYIYRRKK